MSSNQPRHWLVVGDKVLDDVRTKAPPEVQKKFVDLLSALEHGPYPGNNLLHATEAKGFGYPNSFVAWFDDVMILYQVMRDQPVVSLIGVLWAPSPGQQIASNDDESGDGS